MSLSFVIDSSVTMTWLFKDEATTPTRELLDRLDSESALAPAWWFLEITNVMALAERKGRITAPEANAFIDQLSRLDIQTDSEAPTRRFDHILPLCRTYQLTSYDAMYLELAVRRQLPLATLDEPLRKAAKKMNVKLLGR